MKVELKKISILTVIFSAFPVAVFMTMLGMGILDVFSPDTIFNMTFLMSMIMQAILDTLLFLVFTALFLFVYNVLCGIGVRAVTIELQDKE